MSDDADKQTEVGYRKPPAEHRFAKGKSGNPKGRPRKPKATQHRQQTNSLDFGRQPANALLLEEAYRPVTIREGDRLIEIPSIQATYRAMNLAAMKGNRLAQRMVAELVRNVEEEDRQLRSEHMKTAIEYKTSWEENIEYARRRRIPEPQPVPHPDDVYIDLRTATVHYNGPLTPEDKIDWDAKLKRRDEAQSEVTYYADRYRRARDVKRKELLLNGWHHEQRNFDVINDNLPRRYRVKLENRSWEESASREGSQKTMHWPGE